jgi:non-specific serine/threonine protein kinase
MDATPGPTFGDLLRRYRLTAGLTQEELAEKSQISPRAISDLERGQRTRPWRDTIQLLAQALHLTATNRARLEAAARGARAAPAASGERVPAPEGVPRRSNLPLSITSFVGREREVAEIKRLLSETRLLTLTGTGGCGKTRLALEVGAKLVPSYPDGVWLVELAPLGDPTFVPQTVAHALGVQEIPGIPILRPLLDFLLPRRLLLLVDNCEHLIAACAELIDAILRVCPGVTILATSREALGLAGERAWRVPSLTLPNAAERTAGAEPGSLTRESEAVQLFVERARAADPSFALTAQSAPALIEICRRLDGIPLALELAAARLKVLSVEQVAARLDDRFRLLTGGSRTALPRQQTLRATLDWSHSLLSPPEQQTLQRLAVFGGGCTLEAAEAVCGGDGLPAGDVLDLLSQLVGKSLVFVDKELIEPRYRLQESIRQYGRDRLVEADDAGGARERHFDWFLGMAERAEPELLGRGQVEWLDRLEVENDNLRAALEWGLAAEPEAGARLAGHLWQFWYFPSQITEGIHWLEAALGVAPRGTSLYAKLLAGIGHLLRESGQRGPAREHAEQVVALSQRIGEDLATAWALNNLGNLYIMAGDPETGRKCFHESVRVFEAAGSRPGVGMGLRDLGLTAMMQGDGDRAQALLEESLAVLRDIGDRWNLAWTLTHLGELTRRQKDYARAGALADESLILGHEVGNEISILRAQGIRGEVARMAGELDLARDLLVEILARNRTREVAPIIWISLCLCSLGRLAIQRGDSRTGVVLISAGQRRLTGPLFYPAADQAEDDEKLALARLALDEDEFTQALAKGQSMTRQQAIAYALEEMAD